MKTFNNPIFVTRPYLPDLDEYKIGLEEIWRNQWLTNNGPVLQRFEGELAEYLGTTQKHLALFNNGTLALEIGFQAMGLSGGEVITTPFTFVATSHALKRIGAEPVFADVNPETLCLDPAACEKLITPRTKAIVPVHVYGHPCDVEGFAELGRKYGLKIIYDAAHAFGVRLGGKAISEYGDMAMFSFHPTKLFHSCEGGCLVFRNPAIKASVERLRNFAILSELECVDVGTNAKMNELQALMGECCLRKIDELIAWRKMVHDTYREAFVGVEGLKFLEPKSPNGLEFVPNFAYCSILFKDFSTRERVYEGLKAHNIFARRYFYPLLTDFAPYKTDSSLGVLQILNAQSAAVRVLTLPTYYGLEEASVRTIAECVKRTIG